MLEEGSSSGTSGGTESLIVNSSPETKKTPAEPPMDLNWHLQTQLSSLEDSGIESDGDADDELTEEKKGPASDQKAFYGEGCWLSR